MATRLGKTLALVAGLLLLVSAARIQAGEAVSKEQAKAAVTRLVKEQKYSEAADILLRLHTAFPDDQRVLFDCVAVLSWAERYQEAADLSGDYLKIRPPKYSLSAAALAFRRIGQFDQAIALYKDGQTRYPDDPEFPLGRILSLVDAERFDEAGALAGKFREDWGETPELAEAEQYLSDRRTDQEFNLRRQRTAILARDGKYDEAIEELSRLKQERPGAIGVDYDMLTVLSWAGRHREAVQLAQTISLADAPEYVRQAAAVSLREAGDAQSAETLFRRMLADNPGNIQAAEGLVYTLIRENRLDDAEGIILQYKEADQSGRMAKAEAEQVRLRRNAAVETAAKGRADRAVEELERVDRLFPGYPGVRYDIVAILSGAGRDQEALRHAAGMDIDKAPAYVRKAVAKSYRAAGRLAESKRAYRRLLTEYPDDPALIEGMALTLIELKELDAAGEFINSHLPKYSAALKEADARLTAKRRDEAAVLARQGKYDEALQRLDALKKSHPDFPGLDYDRLMIYSWAGRHRQAAEAAKSIQLDNAPDFVRLAAAVSYRETGNSADAEKLYRRLLDADPDNPVLAEGMALTLIRADRTGEAQRLIDSFRSRIKPSALADAEKALVASLRDKAVELGRKERFAEALAELNALRQRDPGDLGVLHDYIVILSWAGRYDDAVRLGANQDPSRTPQYAVEAVASSLRKLGRLEQARDYGRRAAAAHPGSASLAAGLAMTLYDLGQAEAGMALLDDFIARNPKFDGKDIADARSYLNPPKPYSPPTRPDTPYRGRQDAIVVKARAGRLDTALEEMRALHREYPDDVYVLGDYIVLLNWARNHEASLDLVPGLDLALANDYVVVSVMESLMAIGNYYRAEAFLDDALKAQRGNAELMVAGAVPLALGGDVGKALAYLDRAGASRVPGIGNRIAEVRKAVGIDLLQSLKNLRRTDAETGLDANTATLNRFRAGHLGHDKINRIPGMALDTDSRLGGKYISATQTTVWGEQTALPRDMNPHNRYFMDAIGQLDEMLADPACAGDPGCSLRVSCAKIRAFYEMNMACEAIAEYEAIRDSGASLPDGTLLDAAGAYLGARYPAQAKCLYVEVLLRADGPTPPTQDDLFEAKKGLFWALLENEDLDLALAQADQHYREGIGQDGTAALYENSDWRKMDVNIVRGLAYLYCNFMATAEVQLKALVDEAPANAGALSALASTYAMRGLPRTANDAVHLAQIHEPSDIGLATKEATNYLNYNEWRKTRWILDNVLPYYSQDNGVQQLQRDWDTHNCYELRIDVSWSRVTQGKSPLIGNDNSPTLETRLFSRPIKYDWRVFGGYATTSSDFDEGHARQNLYLAGVEYRGPLLTATLEARADRVNDYDAGLALYGQVTPDDHWRFPFSFELLSRDTPLRARYNGIKANSFGGGASYYWNESRSVNTYASFMDFSDNNRRYAVGGDFNQRLWTCYNHYIDGQINMYTSHNSKDGDRPYFNPKRDLELGAALTYGNLLWRCYDRSLRHALTVGAGNYYQKYFGSDLVWSATYSQSFDYTDRFSLTYGVGFDRRVYDGAPEHSVKAFLSAVYKF